MDSYAYYVHSPYSFTGPTFVPRSSNVNRTNSGHQPTSHQQPAMMMTPMPAQRSCAPSVITPFPRMLSDDSSLFVPSPVNSNRSPIVPSTAVSASASCGSLCSTYSRSIYSASAQSSANYLMAQTHSPVCAPPAAVPTSRALALSLIPSRMGPTPTTTITAPQPLAEIVRAVPQQQPAMPMMMAMKNAFLSVHGGAAGLCRTVSTDSTSMASEVSVIPDAELPISPRTLQLTAQTTEVDLTARPAGKPVHHNNVLLTVPGCCHKKEWKRLRSKKGFGYYRCELCGAKWKTAGSARCASSANTSPVEGEESD